MNVRKPVDYGTMYRELTVILAQKLSQMDEIYAGAYAAIWKTRAKSLHLPDRYLSYLSGFVYWTITSM